MTFCAILSISLLVNLPGLAVTPMLGTLSEVFPKTTQLEKQMLTVLPNLVIIPFVLLSGKLSLSRHKIGVIMAGLLIFMACGMAYFFSDSMMMLIVVSCLLGGGAGLLIPFSQGLISDTFAGKYRMEKMGLVSGISNTSLVAATFVVGWLSHGNWHLPFAVYLIAVIPLALSFWLKKIPRDELLPPMASPSSSPDVAAPAATGEKVAGGLYIGRLSALMGVYAFITFATIVLSLYCPFLIEKKDWSPSLTGTITSIFFLFILIPGYAISWIVKILKKWTFIFSALIMTAGLALFAFLPLSWSMCVGAAFAGFGYGLCQPLIYDKASRASISQGKSTLAIAIVLSANYIAIVLTPFIIDGLRSLLHAHGNGTFAFIVCFILLAAYTVMAFLFRNTFAFAVNKSYYQDKQPSSSGQQPAPAKKS